MSATADMLKTLGIWRSRGCRAGLQYHAKSMSIPVRITCSQRRPTTRNTNQNITSVLNATAVKYPRKQGKRCLTRSPANSVLLILVQQLTVRMLVHCLHVSLIFAH